LHNDRPGTETLGSGRPKAKGKKNEEVGKDSGRRMPRRASRRRKEEGQRAHINNINRAANPTCPSNLKSGKGVSLPKHNKGRKRRSRQKRWRGMFWTGGGTRGTPQYCGSLQKSKKMLRLRRKRKNIRPAKNAKTALQRTACRGTERKTRKKGGQAGRNEPAH